MKNITVIGSGIIGLTTAIKLEREGYNVRIITRNLHFKTTSAVAAAIWMPFKAAPVELVNQWSLETYEVFRQQSLDPITGISMVDFIYLSQEDNVPEWEKAAPPGSLRKATKSELPPSYSFAYIAHVPLIETPIYLDFLFDEFRGEIVLDEILNFEEIERPDSWIINCTGLGSRVLAKDTLLYPIKGQIVKMEA
ncbi:MAG: D-amino-acid oxidase, partial [Saprospiraceae bacterium]